jgi:hypothetical protein
MDRSGRLPRRQRLGRRARPVRARAHDVEARAGAGLEPLARDAVDARRVRRRRRDAAGPLLCLPEVRPGDGRLAARVPRGDGDVERGRGRVGARGPHGGGALPEQLQRHAEAGRDPGGLAGGGDGEERVRPNTRGRDLRPAHLRPPLGQLQVGRPADRGRPRLPEADAPRRVAAGSAGAEETADQKGSRGHRTGRG